MTLTTDTDRDALVCATHRACRREPGDCCVIGSVIGGWDTQYELEAHRAELLHAALIATRDHDELGEPCWCDWRIRGTPHGSVCLQARAALGGCNPTTPAATGLGRCGGCGAYVEADPRTPEGRGHPVPDGKGSLGFCGPIDEITEPAS